MQIRSWYITSTIVDEKSHGNQPFLCNALCYEIDSMSKSNLKRIANALNSKNCSQKAAGYIYNWRMLGIRNNMHKRNKTKQIITTEKEYLRWDGPDHHLFSQHHASSSHENNSISWLQLSIANCVWKFEKLPGFDVENPQFRLFAVCSIIQILNAKSPRCIIQHSSNFPSGVKEKIAGRRIWSLRGWGPDDM